jgi:ABC-type lipoprotein release transport system permease subunit
VLALARVNIRGRLGRSALSALGVACGVSTVVALLALTGGLNSSAGDLAHLGRADFGVFQGGLSDLTASTLPNATIARVARLPGVAAATPIEILAGAIAGEPETLVFGAQSESFLAHRLVIIAGRRFGANEAMVGKGAASILHVAPGQSITVDGDQLPIAGIYSSGIPLEDSGVVVPLALARRLSGRSETISMIAVSIAPGYSEAHVRAQVQRALPGTVAIGAPGELERVDTNSRIIHEAAIIVALLALALGAAVVLNTAALAVVERRSELAVLQALGWSRLRICALLASESLLTSAAGVLLGLGRARRAGACDRGLPRPAAQRADLPRRDRRRLRARPARRALCRLAGAASTTALLARAGVRRLDRVRSGRWTAIRPRVNGGPAAEVRSMAERPAATLILLRHGESEWNERGLFTGWVDVDLSERGEEEAIRAGKLLADSGLEPALLHTSVLTRAIRTAEIALGAAGRSWIPVRRSWRLNERHYGALQG